MVAKQPHPAKVVDTGKHFVYLVNSKPTSLFIYGMEGAALNGETASYLQEIQHDWLGNPKAS